MLGEEPADHADDDLGNGGHKDEQAGGAGGLIGAKEAGEVDGGSDEGSGADAVQAAPEDEQEGTGKEGHAGGPEGVGEQADGDEGKPGAAAIGEVADGDAKGELDEAVGGDDESDDGEGSAERLGVDGKGGHVDVEGAPETKEGQTEADPLAQAGWVQGTRLGSGAGHGLGWDRAPPGNGKGCASVGLVPGGGVDDVGEGLAGVKTDEIVEKNAGEPLPHLW